MKSTVEYPMERPGYCAEFLHPANVVHFVRTAEAAGFGAIAFSEHPAPSRKWLAAGCHDTPQPAAATGFAEPSRSRDRLAELTSAGVTCGAIEALMWGLAVTCSQGRAS